MITDPRSSLTKTKSSQKDSSFPAEMPLIKLIEAANLQSPAIARKFLPLCHRNTRLGCALTNAIILVSQKNKTAAMLVGIPEHPVRVKLSSYVKTLFCSNKFA